MESTFIFCAAVEAVTVPLLLFAEGHVAEYRFICTELQLRLDSVHARVIMAKESAIIAFRNGKLMTPVNAQEFSFAPVLLLRKGQNDELPRPPNRRQKP